MSKRWLTIDWPMALEKKHASKAAAYRHVAAANAAYMEGSSRVSLVTVKVSEDKGPWQTYERVQLNGGT